jgi:hemerythrin-like domain-containing protein
MAAHEQNGAATIRDAMLADHHRIDAMLTRVVVALEALDLERAAREWEDFAKTFAAHVDAEDRYLISPLSVVRPRDARALLQEHRHIRARARELENAIKMRALRPETLSGFIDELSAHVRHETTVLYDWAEDEIDASDRDAVLRAVTAAPGARR